MLWDGDRAEFAFFGRAYQWVGWVCGLGGDAAVEEVLPGEGAREGGREGGQEGMSDREISETAWEL